MSKQIPPKKSKSTKKPHSMEPRPGTVRIDRAKVDAIRKLLGIGSIEELSNGTIMSRQSLNRYLNLGEISTEHLKSLADRLETTPESLMPISSFTQSAEPAFEIVPPQKWNVLEFVSSPTSAANGLTYTIAKLQSTLISEQFARGKFYYLAGVDQKNQSLLHACLSRHAVVCECCNNGVRIARNRTVIPLGNDTACNLPPALC